jgi:outer membrane protein
MNRLARYAWLAMATVALGAAQVKLGVINSQKAVLDTAEIKKAQADLEAKFKPRQDQMLKLQKDLQDIQAQLQSGKLNQLGEQELTAQGQKKQRDLKRLDEDLQADVNAERNDILQRTGTRMQEVVKKLADEKGLDVVIDTANTIYFKAALELTADAVAAYNKAYPVK